jgi:hypothetical protein
MTPDMSKKNKQPAKKLSTLSATQLQHVNGGSPNIPGVRGTGSGGGGTSIRDLN